MSSFTATHWSLVLVAGQSDSPEAHAALTRLCHDYWHLLYTHVRSRGHDAHDAQDGTLEFFERLLERNWMQQIHPAKGRDAEFAVLQPFLSSKPEGEEYAAHPRSSTRLKPNWPSFTSSSGWRL